MKLIFRRFLEVCMRSFSSLNGEWIETRLFVKKFENTSVLSLL
ncbi:hypothetical protein LEP1GSC008_0255 [Leptospira kirschneri serovar Bulgarica str. Nikolaevo]|uniref:Uncharacterized protein n=1 Tax=Leptospira kirschneri serovar Bulgarica str. Nikolaevo TaxID=1240687 RepID=M6F6M3_9LEPT|nr:hypothetical protein LEP1GSC008_0255 [Leptospira kirschneri serovar Bulgarica str. Nikolaevo]